MDISNRKENTKNVLLSIILIILFYIIVRYCFPLIVALGIALILIPIANYLESKGMSKKYSSLTVSAVFYLIIVTVLYFLVKLFIIQLYDITSKISNDPYKYIEIILSYTERISAKYPKISSLISSDTIKNKLVEKITEISAILLEYIAGMVISVPDIIMFIFTMIVSTYYLILYRKNIGLFLRRVLNKTLYSYILDARQHFMLYLKQYVYASIIMFVITFIILDMGLLILGVNYSLIISLIISFADMLPVIGVGAALVPWSILMFVTKDLEKGVGLLIIYLILFLIRQFVEPGILSRGSGLPPFITLLSMYIGYKMFGLIGLLLSPLISAVLSSLIKDINRKKHSINS